MLEQSGIVRSDLRSSFGNAGGTAQGVPMTLELTVADLANLADGGAGQLGAVTGSASSGYAVTLTAGVDTTTTPTGGGTAGAPAGAPPAPPAG
ncbi:hypothetical protein [Kocuria turfanensis]|uniref:Uncharacterized protein n=1 Tax=Kocuria turfanensis TaxID=388357 RepID=A0A512IG41_9MICC|nr:hypothetical protein [Kocuria turfanensis]GEO96648.1 hypothetical protein KTU01_27710 [Kocuria turfanensis]